MSSILITPPTDPIELDAYNDALAGECCLQGLAECEVGVYLAYHKKVSKAIHEDPIMQVIDSLLEGL